MFLNDIFVPYIVKIHLDSHLNSQELYCNEFYEIKSVFDVSVYNLKWSQPVSKYTDSLLANFGNPVIILANLKNIDTIDFNPIAYDCKSNFE
jgi:hypothetical protein